MRENSLVNCFQIKTVSLSFLPTYTVDFGLCSLHNHINQFLVYTSMQIYRYISPFWRTLVKEGKKKKMALTLDDSRAVLWFSYFSMLRSLKEWFRTFTNLNSSLTSQLQNNSCHHATIQKPVVELQIRFVYQAKKYQLLCEKKN